MNGICVAVNATTSVRVLHARVAGATWLVLLVLVVLVVGGVNLGIALSFFARNELQVVQFIPWLFLPQVFLGRLFWPVQTLHPALRSLSQLFPLTHATAALRSLMIGGGGIHDILGRLLALLALSLAMGGPRCGGASEPPSLNPRQAARPIHAVLSCPHRGEATPDSSRARPPAVSVVAAVLA